MEIVICPECKIRVVPSASGDCPSCNRDHETFLPYTPLNCTEQKAPAVQQTPLVPAEAEQDHEAKNLWNAGAKLRAPYQDSKPLHVYPDFAIFRIASAE